MNLHYEPIRRLIDQVRARRRAVIASQSVVRAGLSVSAIVGLALAVSIALLSARSPLALAAVFAIALIVSLAAIVWALRPLRERPSDVRLARLVEERVPSLDDRLVTAVDVVSSRKHESTRLLAEPLVRDAARRAAAVDVDLVIAAAVVQRSRLQAVAALALLVVLLFMAKEPARQSLDAASLALFPARVTLDVAPGDATVKEGSTLSVEARLVGNSAPVPARLEVENGSTWQPSSMVVDAAGHFRATVPAVTKDFRYRVAAASITSPVYRVRVTSPPRVAGIDVEYTYPAELGLPPHTDTDAGDVYAPAGTNVRLQIHTQRPVTSGTITLAGGGAAPVAFLSPTELTSSMTITSDGSYRVGLVDRDGLTNDTGNEYFIRVVDDRPPDVHVVKPASDRRVTPLEEVDIEAQADDDYGLDRVELVYAVRGEAEKAVPLAIPRRATTAIVKHTIYLEDLGVRPGDFVAYYVRARDVAKGSRSKEGRSDIFFLEVRPFEQEFALAESQSMAGSGYNGSIDDLVNAQKQIVVATWKIDRRTAAATGARSPSDIRAIGQSESDLRVRAEEVASSFRESTMRDPRSRPARGGGNAPMPEEAAMSKAVDAMTRAVGALDALKTSAAMPPEMQALNALIEAQALVKKRQVSRQQSAQGGPGNNNRNYDISTLFDKELQRLQETNYETRASSQANTPDALAEKIKALARRQDELLRRERQLQSLSEEERKRELEKLTREQAQLRQEAEELANAPRDAASANASSQMREIARDMQGAANDLRRQDPKSSESRGRQALDKLQRLSQDDRRQPDKGLNASRLQRALEQARDLREKLSKAGRNQTQELARQLQDTRDLIDQLRREDPSLSSGGPGFTYEGQGMTFSAPGTEGFKQDYSKWEELRQQATRALDGVTAALSKKLGDGNSRDRAAAGVDDTAPAPYQSQVDAYFKAIAARKAQ